MLELNPVASNQHQMTGPRVTIHSFTFMLGKRGNARAVAFEKPTIGEMLLNFHCLAWIWYSTCRPLAAKQFTRFLYSEPSFAALDEVRR